MRHPRLVRAAALAFAVVCASAQSAPCRSPGTVKGTRMDIASITRSLLNDATTARRSVDALGPVAERRNRGYFVVPNADFREIWVATDAEAPDGPPVYLRLGLAETSTLRLADLVTAFGAWKRVPPTPEGSAFDVVFRCDDPALPFLGIVLASMTGDPASPASRITTVTIRREPRL